MDGEKGRIVSMTIADSIRLAHIRMQNIKNQYLYHNANTWDSVFLVKVIDSLIEERKQLKATLRRASEPSPNHAKPQDQSA